MNKSIKQFNNNINFYENLNYQEIPDNKLYYCLIKIIDTMKNSKDYKIVTGKFLLRQGIDPDDNNNWANS